MDKKEKGQHKREIADKFDEKIAALELRKIEQQESMEKLLAETQREIDLLTLQRDALNNFKII